MPVFLKRLLSVIDEYLLIQRSYSPNTLIFGEYIPPGFFTFGGRPGYELIAEAIFNIVHGFIEVELGILAVK